jgi:predicted nucleic acid binding AN1-type Zn finger protein
MKCAVNGCTDRAAKIIGDCRYCDLSYCSTHRLPESHHCDNISTCRQESYDRNSTKLLGEKCVADKL